MESNRNLVRQLQRIIPDERIRHRLIDRIAFASDAGFYHLIPKAIVQPVNEDEIRAIFMLARDQRVPVVFRTGGTSLSGQSITDGILVDLGRHWRKILPEDNGQFVRVEPGAIGGVVNSFLRKYRRKIGPDPSSINAAMMGGILSNNASGMCCGVVHNSYHTVRYIRFMLPDGATYSTEEPDDYNRFIRDHADLSKKLLDWRMAILENEPLRNKIRHKYLTKNTVGYSLNSLLDFERPLDILAHLLIGAEGTLAFISEAVLETIVDHPFKSTALLYFENIYDACQAIVPLTESGATAVELMDRASLRAIENSDGIPVIVKSLPAGAAALLVEFQQSSEQLLNQQVASFGSHSKSLALLAPPEFTRDEQAQHALWKIRKGLFPAVGAVRASGTTVILEDIAFPVPKLGDAIIDLQHLFQKFDYSNAIIFGHAKDGNIHFVVTQPFRTPEEVARYERFMEEVVALVVQKYDGALKAEHGTGRNMAPFVETEWGGDAYEIMKSIKNSIDPDNLLNPGVIINSDRRIHVKNLKALPGVEPEVDMCIECGFCESKCPSRHLTLTPRQRIVVRRGMETIKNNGSHLHSQLVREYDYDGLDTCAVDGMCATSCPVDINTGDLVKRLRTAKHSPLSQKLAVAVAGNFQLFQAAVRTALNLGTFLNTLFGRSFMTTTTKNIKRFLPTFPLWPASMPAPPALRHRLDDPDNDREPIIYFPSCITRMIGSCSKNEIDSQNLFIDIARRAGFDVRLPKHMNALCCGQIFSSKGLTQAYSVSANSIVKALWQISEGGKIPVVTDVSSCAFTLQRIATVLSEECRAYFSKLTVLDSVDFIHDFALSKLTVVRKKTSITLHPVCSLHKMKSYPKFVRVASHFAGEVTIPESAGCCGMAGDRGFLFPELTASALQQEADEVMRKSYDGYYSSTKTCEIALSEATKADYQSILALVRECTTPG